MTEKQDFKKLSTESNPKFIYHIEGINWDTSEDDPEMEEQELSSLPENVILKTSSEEDEVIDKLSDHYGFCIYGVNNITVSENKQEKKKRYKP